MFGEVIFSRYNDKEILCVYEVSKSIWINRQEIYFIGSSQIIGTHQQTQFTALLYYFHSPLAKHRPTRETGTLDVLALWNSTGVLSRTVEKCCLKLVGNIIKAVGDKLTWLSSTKSVKDLVSATLEFKTFSERPKQLRTLLENIKKRKWRYRDKCH